MSVAEDRMAEIQAAFGEYKHYIANVVAAKDAQIEAHLKTIQEKEAEVADAQKKLQDAADSSVSLDSFHAFADRLIADIKGAMA
jgi:uncharacterized membrane protein (DUF106 family)